MPHLNVVYYRYYPDAKVKSCRRSTGIRLSLIGYFKKEGYPMNLKDAAANLNQAHPEDTLHPMFTPWGEAMLKSASGD